MFDIDEHANLEHKYLNYYGEKFYSSGPGFEPQTSKKDRLNTGPYRLPKQQEVIVSVATAK